MLKDLEKKLRDNHAAWTEDNLWNAFAVTAPGKLKGRSQVGRFADLVALVRFALEQHNAAAWEKRISSSANNCQSCSMN